MAAKKNVKDMLFRVDRARLSYNKPELMNGAQLMERSGLTAATIHTANANSRALQHPCTFDGMADVLLICRVDIPCTVAKPAGTVSPLLPLARSRGTAVLRGPVLGPTDRFPPSFRTGGL